MLYLAQTIDSGFDGLMCADYNDQGALLGNIWFIMLVTSLVLAVIFYLLKNRKFGLLFALYFILLLLAKLLYTADECGHGGLFEFTQSRLLMLGIFAILLIGSFILGLISYFKNRNS